MINLNLVFQLLWESLPNTKITGIFGVSNLTWLCWFANVLPSAPSISFLSSTNQMPLPSFKSFSSASLSFFSGTVKTNYDIKTKGTIIYSKILIRFNSHRYRFNIFLRKLSHILWKQNEIRFNWIIIAEFVYVWRSIFDICVWNLVKLYFGGMNELWCEL